MPHNFGNQRKTKITEFLRPKHKSVPIYELVRNWVISFCGKVCLTSLLESTQEKRIETVPNRRNRIENGEGKTRTRRTHNKITDRSSPQKPRGHEQTTGLLFPRTKDTTKFAVDLSQSRATRDGNPKGKTAKWKGEGEGRELPSIYNLNFTSYRVCLVLLF